MPSRPIGEATASFLSPSMMVCLASPMSSNWTKPANVVSLVQASKFVIRLSATSASSWAMAARETPLLTRTSA